MNKQKITPELEEKLNKVEAFFKDPKNIEIIEANKAYSQKVSKFIQTSQSEFIKEMNREIMQENPQFTI